jgi:hypothetical protein
MMAGMTAPSSRRAWLRAGAPGLGYAAALAGASLVWHAQPPDRSRVWGQWASTNLDNLGHHPLGSLLVSALLTSDDLVAWLVLAVAGLAALAWRLGPWRSLAVAAGAHVLATLVSQGMVAWRIRTGALPEQARRVSDLGPSYVVVAALVAAVLVGPWGARLVGSLGFVLLAPSLFGGLGQLDVTAVGHLLSIGFGLAGAALLSPGQPSGGP